MATTSFMLLAAGLCFLMTPAQAERKDDALEPLLKELHVQENTAALTMRLQGDVLFDAGQSTLRPAAQAALDKVASVLAQFPSAKVEIEGHTDSKGTPPSNLELSENRALAVQEYLKKRAELAGIHFTTRGRGETKPIAPNDTDEGRQQNRRVEITVTK
jgi:outer membrane protein OmpA-like peptidoglycan-associated protein